MPEKLPAALAAPRVELLGPSPPKLVTAKMAASMIAPAPSSACSMQIAAVRRMGNGATAVFMSKRVTRRVAAM